MLRKQVYPSRHLRPYCTPFRNCCNAVPGSAPNAPTPSPFTGPLLPPTRIDEAEYDDPEKVTASPLTFEGFAPSVSAFVLLWVTTFTLAHSST